MLRFFNRYGKYVMVAIMALLMVAFTIQPVISMFNPDPGKAAAATFADGTEVSNNELARAEGMLTLLEQLDFVYSSSLVQAVGTQQAMNMGLINIFNGGALSPVFRPLYDRGGTRSERAERWLMLQHDAAALGIDASSGEVFELLEAAFGTDSWTFDDEAKNRATAQRAMRQPAGVVRDVARQLLVAQKYADEVTGRPYEADLVADLQARSFGVTPARLSEPLRQRLVVDSNARVTGRYTLIDADRYTDEVPQPTAQRVQRTFEAYRDAAPDAWGRFGYRYPDRYKLEYLIIEPARLADAVDPPTPVEVTAYYNANRDSFDGRSEYDARGEVVEAIKAEREQALAVRVADRALDILDRQLAGSDGVTRVGSGFELPEGFVPMPLSEVAGRLTSEFGVRVAVSDDVLADEWLTAEDLLNTPELNGLEYRPQADRPGTPLADYVAAVQEMDPAPTNPLVALAGQVGVPLKRLVAYRSSLDGTQTVQRYAVVRVREASPAHAPQTLSEVVDRVTADARRELAYERLVAQQDAWAARVAAEGIQAVADAERSALNDLSVPRREIGPRGIQVPEVPGAGRSQVLVEQLFEAAGDRADGTSATGVVALEDARALALFEVDNVIGVPRSEYQQRVGGAISMEGLVASGTPERDPLGLEVLRERTGWTLSRRPGDRDAAMDAGDEDDAEVDDASE